MSIRERKGNPYLLDWEELVNRRVRLTEEVGWYEAGDEGVILSVHKSENELELLMDVAEEGSDTLWVEFYQIQLI